MSSRLVPVSGAAARHSRLLSPAGRSTGRHISRFELTRIVAMRCSQLQAGAAPLVAPPAGFEGRSWELYRICHQEIRLGLLQVNIGRPQPDGTMLWIPLSELDIDERMFVQPHFHHDDASSVFVRADVQAPDHGHH